MERAELELWHTRKDLKNLDSLRSKGPIVLVPTMGALHQGHLSLVERASELGTAVVTIFVNPTQFGPNEDFDSYPRTLDRDLELLKDYPVAGVFAPEVSEIYGAPQGVMVQPGHRGMGLCGGSRPDHFSGVLTVVAKLFGLVQPDIAIFGRKDAQQCLVIGQMVEDLKMNIELIDAPTLRESDGLAMSSRNRYLSNEQRQQALCLSQALNKAKDLLVKGCCQRKEIVGTMEEILQTADALDYAEVRQVPNLEIEETLTGKILLAVAAKVGPARLIDNLVLELKNNQVADSYLLGTGRKS
ncbi:MAG: pantoate--beta-alanine ligase [bacterium]|nr:pantoate--beta-alanine ligase [bacterium]